MQLDSNENRHEIIASHSNDNRNINDIQNKIMTILPIITILVSTKNPSAIAKWYLIIITTAINWTDTEWIVLCENFFCLLVIIVKQIHRLAQKVHEMDSIFGFNGFFMCRIRMCCYNWHIAFHLSRCTYLVPFKSCVEQINMIYTYQW